jgi:hypothetical protein
MRQQTAVHNIRQSITVLPGPVSNKAAVRFEDDVIEWWWLRTRIKRLITKRGPVNTTVIMFND